MLGVRLSRLWRSGLLLMDTLLMVCGVGVNVFMYCFTHLQRFNVHVYIVVLMCCVRMFVYVRTMPAMCIECTLGPCAF